jgi:hypothetical protein
MGVKKKTFSMPISAGKMMMNHRIWGKEDTYFRTNCGSEKI